MSVLFVFLTVAAIHALAVMSPGPDFAMITATSLTYRRHVGVWASAGLALGILVHITYSMVGIGFVLARSILLFSAMKFAGAAYLIIIGWKAIRSRPRAAGPEGPAESVDRDMSWLRALRLGFLTNVLNPKATIFFVALFTQVIDPTTPLPIKILYGAEMSAATFLWFAFLATTLSHQAVKRRVRAAQHWIERVAGAVLILFGLKLALAQND